MLTPSILTGKKNIITVVLSENNTQIEKNFRCVVCGKICFQYYSSIELIIAGYQAVRRPPLVIQCNRTVPVMLANGRQVEGKCKARYFVV